MPTVLAISSYVAASHVGLGAITPALWRCGCRVIGAPTVAFGRHPGWGRPGGAALDGPTFADLLDGALDHPDAAALDWALTGYFASAEQVRATAEALAAVKAARPGLTIAVDPVMGDADTGRYVAADVPDALSEALLPLADLVLPNAWEAEQLTGRAIASPEDAVAAARALGRPAVISSVPVGAELGAVYAAPGAETWVAHAPAFPDAPRGTGDYFAGAFVGELARGTPPPKALARAAGRVFVAIDRARRRGSAEMAVDADHPDTPVALRLIFPEGSRA